MTKIELLRSELIKARKEKNKAKSACLQNLIGKMETNSKSEKGYVMDDITVVKEIRKAIKNNKDAIKEFGSNEEYKAGLEAEIKFLSQDKFLPSMMSEEQIKEIINEVKPSNIGEAMKYFKANYDGQVDNALVSKLVKQSL